MPTIKSATNASVQFGLAEARDGLFSATSPESYRAYLPLLSQLSKPMSVSDGRQSCDTALSLCQNLYANGRPFDALPFAKAALVQANMIGDKTLIRRATTACGLLLADTRDFVGGIEHHIDALHIAAETNDTVGMSRDWNNIGVAFLTVGQYEYAISALNRSLQLTENIDGAVFSRYCVLSNTALCQYKVGEYQNGLKAAFEARKNLTPEFIQQDIHVAVLLHRNFVRLHIASNQLNEAQDHAKIALDLAYQSKARRPVIAALTAQAACEVALGEYDIGLTRLEQSLATSRTVPATLQDTLSCLIQAEEAAGNSERALLRHRELTEHMRTTVLTQVQKHIELASLDVPFMSRTERLQRQTEYRLSKHQSTPSAPASWPTLLRLAMGSAYHAKKPHQHASRVGTLTQMLAAEIGFSSLAALEVGLAAQLHDIGMIAIPEGMRLQEKLAETIARDRIEQHCKAGVQMLSDDTHPRILLAKEIAQYHHAAWDGTGFPSHVAGDAIPLAARLCAVADAFDTILISSDDRTNDIVNHSLKRLREQSGKILDPELVSHFERAVKRESVNHGLDSSGLAGTDGFHHLVAALAENRGFL